MQVGKVTFHYHLLSFRSNNEINVSSVLSSFMPNLGMQLYCASQVLEHSCNLAFYSLLADGYSWKPFKTQRHSSCNPTVVLTNTCLRQMCNYDQVGSNFGINCPFPSVSPPPLITICSSVRLSKLGLVPFPIVTWTSRR